MKTRIIVSMLALLMLLLSACGAAQDKTIQQASEAQSAHTALIEATTSPTVPALPTTPASAVEASQSAPPEVVVTPTAPTPAEAAPTEAIPAAAPATATAQPSPIPATPDAVTVAEASPAVVPIVLTNDAIAVDGPGATAEGSTVTITAGGHYRVSGTLGNGQLLVNAADDAVVRLLLDGVDIRNATSAGIHIVSADAVVLTLAEGTNNSVVGGAVAVEGGNEDEPSAAIFSMADLTIAGPGALTVNGTTNDGITSKDDLTIESGSITVQAVDDGLRGKDALVVKDGTLTVSAQGDGLKADNAEDPAKGYVSIERGTINVTAGGDAIQAQTDVIVADGNLTLTTGGGSGNLVGADLSAKGIKAVGRVIIDGGTLAIDAADDALHSNGSLAVNAGSLTLASSDDGIHADASVDINGGAIQITQSYEGIESGLITINAGEIHLTSYDDGINVAGGNDGSGMGRMGPGGGQETFASYTGANFLRINGGALVVDSAGDGLDSNGAIEMTGGVVLVNGPTENMNGAVDYDGGFAMTGGFLIAAGSAGMSEAPDSSSSQPAVLINYTAPQAAGTLVHVRNSAGEEILTFAPTKPYQSIAFSSPSLAHGATYEVYSGGSATTTGNDGGTEAGSYTPGTAYTTFTISEMVTMIGNRSRFR